MSAMVASDLTAAALQRLRQPILINASHNVQLKTTLPLDQACVFQVQRITTLKSFFDDLLRRSAL